MELCELFPDEEATRTWSRRFTGPGSAAAGTASPPAPHLQDSRLPFKKWAYGIYLCATLKGVSSMKLHRDIKITQKTAWFMLRRLREAWDKAGLDRLLGQIEVDETWVGGKCKNMHAKLKKAAQAMDPGHAWTSARETRVCPA